MRIYLLVALLGSFPFSAAAAAEQPRARGPQPGDIYREYTLHNGGDAWRVTDPRASAAGAAKFLPNPVLTLAIGDLQGALRAEVLLDRWGGHLRTTAKQIRFNGHDWLTVPEVSTTPAGARPEHYYSQDNPVIDVPLAHLRSGDNTIEGTCGTIEGYNWGQWGIYSLVLRVYYDPAARPHPTGRIVRPAADSQLGENPDVAVEAASPSGVARVDVLAWYDGYDEDGDGIFQDWHQAYFQPLRGAPAELREHVGTAWREPYAIRWDTHWVPDQSPHSVRLVARVQDSGGIWSVTPVVERLSLVRPGVSVTLYRAANLPERFGVRAGRRQTCTIPLPASGPPQAGAEVVLSLRTWHGWDGHHHPLRLNDHELPIRGKNHHYDYDLLSVPAAALLRGENRLTIHSDTEHHMLEVLWPGPALIVRQRQ
jgi:hypothetical protein